MLREGKEINMKKASQSKVSSKKKLCFGTRTSRDKFYVAIKPRPYPGPFEYYTPMNLIKKLPNKTGYTLLASKTPRASIYEKKDIVPPIGSYELETPRDDKQMAKPFLTGAKIQPDNRFPVPGPGTYTPFERKVRVCTAFGHDRIIFPLVTIVCSPFNLAYCWKCEKAPVGDFWHKKSTKQDMCRPCMEQELNDMKKCGTKLTAKLRMKKELSKYDLTRHCEFFHAHNCTRAAVQQMSTRDLVAKYRKENYLSSYGL